MVGDDRLRTSQAYSFRSCEVPPVVSLPQLFLIQESPMIMTNGPFRFTLANPFAQ
jgi:hypothetical protein